MLQMKMLGKRKYDSIVLLSFYKQGYLEINKREHSLF